MLTSTLYHRDYKVKEYVNTINQLEKKINDPDYVNYKSSSLLDKRSIKIIVYSHCDSNGFIEAFKEMYNDHMTKKSKVANKTLYDICLHDLGNRFRGIFSNNGTHNILLAFYEYMDKLPRYIRLKGKDLSEYPPSYDVYFRHYINTFFCYDVVINLLENYKQTTTMDQMICLEMLINDILYLVTILIN